MRVEEESPKQTVDIARAPDKESAQIALSLRVAARTVGCCVALLDPIDIGPSSGALHPVRPGHNASRAYI
jgi:hypothetical protein